MKTTTGTRTEDGGSGGLAARLINHFDILLSIAAELIVPLLIVIAAYPKGPVAMLDFLGTYVFAYMGAIGTLKASPSAPGWVSLLRANLGGGCTAVGGGTVRSLLLGLAPSQFFYVCEPLYLLLIVLGALMAWLQYSGLADEPHFPAIDNLLDYLSLMGFVLIGVEIAVAREFALAGALGCGVLTGIGGGVLRDVFLIGRVPGAFNSAYGLTAVALGVVTLLPLNKWQGVIVLMLVTGLGFAWDQIAEWRQHSNEAPHTVMETA